MERKKFIATLSFSILFAFGLALRVIFIPATTLDMRFGYFVWYDMIAAQGILPSLASQSFGYNPPFIYLLALATLTKGFLPKIIAIKLIPITFDILNTFIVHRIVKTQFPEGRRPLLAALLFWLAPTIMVNSSFWGQTDSLYTCFLLLALLFLLQQRTSAALFAFGLSVAVKAQGIFFGPLLGLLFFKKRIRWYEFFLVPLAYLMAQIPAVLAGRPIFSLFSTYGAQGETFTKTSMNAPNFYFFLSTNDYNASLVIGIPLAALLLLVWMLVGGRKAYSLTPGILTLAALISLALTPFLLPKMHDRYFYPADIFSLLLAFFLPGTWFVPIAYQVISLLAYAPYLFNVPAQNVVPIAILINTLTIGFLLWKQWTLNKEKTAPTLG